MVEGAMPVMVCPVCHSVHLRHVLERRGVPVHQNLPAPTAAAARSCLRGDLRLVQCLTCGFVFNAAFDETLQRYSPDYENAQTHSSAFRSYLEGLIAELIDRYALTGKTIIEIGCGKGEFLSRLCEAGGNTGIGFDPSYVAGRDEVAPCVTIIPDFYRAGRAQTRGDFICSRHVIEHMAQPRQFLEALREAIGDRTDVAVFFETPDLEWILEHRAFWDIFYEHCSYFAMPVLAGLFRACGFQVLRSRRAFEGQYQWLEARPACRSQSAPDWDTAVVARLAESVREFAADCVVRQAGWARRVAALRKLGRCAVWGAGAKGVTFLNTLQLDLDVVPVVVDLNPRKHGRFIPGTAQPIVSPEALREAGVRTVLVMNANYLAEIREAVEALGLELEITSV
jgi:SAM-dependent methyltransferase